MNPPIFPKREYRLDARAMRRLSREFFLRKSLPCMAVAFCLVAFMGGLNREKYQKLDNTDERQRNEQLGYMIGTIAMPFIASFAVALYFQHQARRRHRQFKITIAPDFIEEVIPGSSYVQIARPDIAMITQQPNGNLLIQNRMRTSTITIPSDLEHFPTLRETLNSWHPITGK